MKQTTNIKFLNSETRQLELFSPKDPSNVKFYSCGPTVYGPIHIGNLRAGLTADLIVRFLKSKGYAITYVRNYTDIDDKIIKKIMETGQDLDSFTQETIQVVEHDYALAGMIEPTYKTRVTDHLGDIVQMIKDIIANKKAYTVDGEVFFSISDFDNYGRLSKKPLKDLIAGARVEPNPNKKNPLDFTLWKPAKPNEPSWPSPWGQGRPGWHIECSAMAHAKLGPEIDIHHGGEDLIFPHHENEIAQSEAATGHSPYVRVWMHNGFLNINDEKMSKSLGNIVLARDFLAKYGKDLTRYLLLSSHYRQIITLNESSLTSSIHALRRIYDAKLAAQNLLQKKITHPWPQAEAAWSGFFIDLDRGQKGIDFAFSQDLNTAGALAEVFQLIREFNRIRTLENAEHTPAALLAAQSLIQVIEQDMGNVIGIGQGLPETELKRLQEIEAQMGREKWGESDDTWINALLQERKTARQAKDFKRGDEIRDELLAKGIEIKDSPQGTTWRRKA